MKYGFIGCGNMGGALAAAAAKTLAEKDTLYLSDPAGVGDLPGIPADNETIAAECDFIVLGVKPQMMRDLLGALRGPIAARQEKPVLVSMAAGMAVETLQEALGTEVSWIRIMPNTPVQVGEGRILYTAPGVAKEKKDIFCALFAKAGTLIELPEHLIDAGSAVSGCGPAFVYLFIEALADGGVACGLPRQTALELAAGTVLGSAKTVLETGKHPGALKDAVCSPAGSTIAGVAALEQGKFRASVMNAVLESYKRTKELGQ